MAERVRLCSDQIVKSDHLVWYGVVAPLLLIHQKLGVEVAWRRAHFLVEFILTELAQVVTFVYKWNERRPHVRLVALGRGGALTTLDKAIEHSFHMSLILQLYLHMERPGSSYHIRRRTFQKLIVLYRAINGGATELWLASGLFGRNHVLERRGLHASILVEVTSLLGDDVRLSLEGRVEWTEEADLVLADLQSLRFKFFCIEKEALAGHSDPLLRVFLRGYNCRISCLHF